MNLLHPANAGAVVSLWFVNGTPVRLVHAARRYSVTAAEHWADEAGWTITARSSAGHSGRFAVRSTTNGWELNPAD